MEDAKPTLNICHNLANRISGKKKHFYEQGLIATMPSNEVISQKTNDVMHSYQMNQIGETNLIFPGQIEEKPTYKYRVAQGIIDLITSHFVAMLHKGKTKQVLCLVSHHNAITEWMRVINRKDPVEKKPAYCWTSAAIIEVPVKELLSSLKEAEETHMNETNRNNHIW